MALTEEEIVRLKELKREVRDNSKYIELDLGDHCILEFDIAKTEYKPDTFNGIEQQYPKHHFVTRQLDCMNKAFRSFKPNAGSGMKIAKFLEENNTRYARIERVDVGKGKSEYVPTAVDDEDIQRLKGP